MACGYRICATLPCIPFIPGRGPGCAQRHHDIQTSSAIQYTETTSYQLGRPGPSLGARGRSYCWVGHCERIGPGIAGNYMLSLHSTPSVGRTLTAIPQRPPSQPSPSIWRLHPASSGSSICLRCHWDSHARLGSCTESGEADGRPRGQDFGSAQRALREGHSRGEGRAGIGKGRREW